MLGTTFFFGRQSVGQLFLESNFFALAVSLSTSFSLSGHFGFSSLHNDWAFFEQGLSGHLSLDFSASGLQISVTVLHFDGGGDSDFEDWRMVEVEKDLVPCKKLEKF